MGSDEFMAKKEEKQVFNFKEYIKEFDLNKYVKEGFVRSLEGKEPKTLKEFEKQLKKYLGE